MNNARALGLAATGALILAIAVGFWPVHANVGVGTASCGSALRPTYAFDTYDVVTDATGAGLVAVEAVDDRCEAARSGPAYASRGLGVAGLVLLVAVAASKRRNRAAGS
ncbi:hypothetical protein E1287_07425 [Actinomadura sp. KC06]|uniref:hypothetical protein n=1 Tax=Actinomadura sp. KC06 TaxID=2530369 RepID=UPI0010518A2C|nr:hypothetical protein [Actinomadura sp. KC06]TDD37878.1 hypothetical protein E1287_07425 [Actinomadura sp. KC06]